MYHLIFKKNIKLIESLNDNLTKSSVSRRPVGVSRLLAFYVVSSREKALKEKRGLELDPWTKKEGKSLDAFPENRIRGKLKKRGKACYFPYY